MTPDFASMFQELVEKIRNDPEAFEKRRREIIKDFISEAPPEYQPGLRRPQVEIKKLRSELPLSKCTKLNRTSKLAELSPRFMKSGTFFIHLYLSRLF